MIDPVSLTTAIDNASKVANTPLFTTIIDKLTGFRISTWAAEGELRKKRIHDEYQKAKESGIGGMQYIEYLRRTTNLIDTATKSAKYIDQNKLNDIKLNNDFFWNTLEHAKTISNENMQDLIAKIIAGEYNTPGTYSMSTLHVLKMLGKEELELFQKICSLCLEGIYLPESIFHPIESIKPVLKSLDINFSSLLSLQNLGLILPHAVGARWSIPVNARFGQHYFHKVIYYEEAPANNLTMVFPLYYELSNSGKEIRQHLDPKYCDSYYKWLRKNHRIKYAEKH